MTSVSATLILSSTSSSVVFMPRLVISCVGLSAEMKPLSVRNHVNLEIHSFVMNFNSGFFLLRVLYCVADTGYGLDRSLRDCRPAFPEGRKYQGVKTQTECHVGGPIV